MVLLSVASWGSIRPFWAIWESPWNTNVNLLSVAYFVLISMFHSPFHLMDSMLEAFTYKRGVLHAEGVNVETLARTHGTPLYVYSLGHVLENYRRLTAAFKGVDHRVCFS